LRPRCSPRRAGSGAQAREGRRSSYWHNGFIYANDISRGFDVFALDHPAVEGAALLDRDNPQTQERLYP